MMMNSPFYIANPIKALAISAVLLGLSACGNVPNKPSTPATSKTEKSVIPSKPLTAENKQDLSLSQLQKLRADAARQARWSDYLLYSTALWHKQKSQPEKQQQIEEQIWDIVRSLPANKLQELSNHPDADIQSWSALQKAFTSSAYEFENELLNLQTFEADAIYQKHLLAKLVAEIPTAKPIQQIAVLLPLE
ncbi:MAG: hypothetical protein R3254_03065, partial [Thiomicrorhabdus sp.]|nr:hypothetical protein [Thiomicrorhabdus sp.]